MHHGVSKIENCILVRRILWILCRHCSNEPLYLGAPRQIPRDNADITGRESGNVAFKSMQRNIGESSKQRLNTRYRWIEDVFVGAIVEFELSRFSDMSGTSKMSTPLGASMVRLVATAALMSSTLFVSRYCGDNVERVLMRSREAGSEYIIRDDLNSGVGGRGCCSGIDFDAIPSTCALQPAQQPACGTADIDTDPPEGASASIRSVTQSSECSAVNS